MTLQDQCRPRTLGCPAFRFSVRGPKLSTDDDKTPILGIDSTTARRGPGSTGGLQMGDGEGSDPMSRAPINSHPFPKALQASQSQCSGHRRARIWPPLWFPRVLLVLEDPRGISGPGTDQQSKGSASLGQGDVSDRNAGRRDNLQTSTGTQDTSWRSPVVLPNNSPLGVVPAKQVAKS